MGIRIVLAIALMFALGVSVLVAEDPIVPKEKTMLWNGQDFAGWTFYLKDTSVDPKMVWSIKDGVIHCKGKPPGYMRTVKDFADYKLHVEWRWADGKGNSGVLLHMSEPDKVWPKSIECQLMSGNAGDFWLIGTMVKEHGGRKGRRIPKKADSSEKPLGEWNVYEIVCKGDTVRPTVNGVLQNEGTEASVTSGKICLQSEGKPIEFRNVYIEPVE